MAPAPEKLTYFLNVKKFTLVASFTGAFGEDCGTLLQKCIEEIRQNKDVRFVVLNMQGATAIDPGAIRAFAQFQVFLREGRKIYLSGLTHTVEKSLNDAGILRTTEVGTDLMSVLQLILKTETGVA
ncbi:MAG: STAS domain-containing protein [Bacteriovoracia bacterium]